MAICCNEIARYRIGGIHSHGAAFVPVAGRCGAAGAINLDIRRWREQSRRPRGRGRRPACSRCWPISSAASLTVGDQRGARDLWHADEGAEHWTAWRRTAGSAKGAPTRPGAHHAVGAGAASRLDGRACRRHARSGASSARSSSSRRTTPSAARPAATGSRARVGLDDPLHVDYSWDEVRIGDRFVLTSDGVHGVAAAPPGELAAQSGSGRSG